MKSSSEGREGAWMDGDAGSSLSSIGGVEGGVGGRCLSVRSGVGPHRMTSEAFCAR